MKTIKKIGIMLTGILLLAFLMSSLMGSKSGSKDMEAARGSAPSTSYQYHLQVFHAF